MKADVKKVIKVSKLTFVKQSSSVWPCNYISYNPRKCDLFVQLPFFENFCEFSGAAHSPPQREKPFGKQVN